MDQIATREMSCTLRVLQETNDHPFLLDTLYVQMGMLPLAIGQGDESLVEDITYNIEKLIEFSGARQKKDMLHISSQRDGEGYRIIFAKNKEKIDELREFLDQPSEDVFGVHLGLGKLLGYPLCCAQTFAEKKELQQDPIKEFNRLALKSPRSWDSLAWLPYVPCSLDCEETKLRAYTIATQDLRPLFRGSVILDYARYLREYARAELLDEGECFKEEYSIQNKILDHLL